MGASGFRKLPIYKGETGASGRVILPASPSVGEKGISYV